MSNTTYNSKGQAVFRITISSDSLTITATDLIQDKVVLQVVRSSTGITVTSSHYGTATFSPSTPNAMGTLHLLGGTQTITSGTTGTYIAPNSSYTGYMNLVSDSNGNMSTTLLQTRYDPYTRNSYNDYGWDKLNPDQSGPTGSGGSGGPVPQYMTPVCLGACVEFAAMACALTGLDFALALVEIESVGLASPVVAAIETMMFGYYAYLVSNLKNSCHWHA